MTHDTFTDAALDGPPLRHDADLPTPAMPSPFRDPTLVELTAELVAAYVSGNSVRPSDLPDLLRFVYGALEGLGRSVTVPAAPLIPAVPIKKSITDDYLICLDDGRKFKSLKRHLAQLGLTPEQYRAKWGLDPSYPMVAPAYAKARSTLAKEIGLGRNRVA